MTNPTTPKTGHQRRAVSPVLIVAGIAVVAFVIALVAFRGGSSDPSTSVDASGQITVPGAASQGSGCNSTSKPDPAYSVVMESEPNPPRAEGTTFHLTVRHDGKAVTGATVCMSADMTEMHHEGINNEAKEASGGKYDATLKFGMRGPYAGSVIVAEPGKAAVSVPVSFQVN